MSENSFEQYKHLVQEQARSLLDVVQSVARGDLDVKVEALEGIPSLSELALGISAMLDGLRETLVEQERAQETQHRTTVLSALYQVGREITATLDLDATLQAIAEDTTRLVRADQSIILLVDAEEKRLSKAVGYGYPAEPMAGFTYQEVEDGISGWVLREGTSTISENILTDPRNTGIALEMARKEGESKSIAVAPLLIEGQAIGTLTAVRSTDQTVFSEDDLILVTMFADRAAIAIENARLFEQTRARARREQALREIAIRMRGFTDPDAIARAAARELGAALGRPAFVRLGSADELVSGQGGD